MRKPVLAEYKITIVMPRDIMENEEVDAALAAVEGVLESGSFVNVVTALLHPLGEQGFKVEVTSLAEPYPGDEL